MSSDPTRTWTIDQITEVWETSYRHINQPIDGVRNSVRYHLHHLNLLQVVTYK
jgi:hypothetical protein